MIPDPFSTRQSEFTSEEDIYETQFSNVYRPLGDHYPVHDPGISDHRCPWGRHRQEPIPSPRRLLDWSLHPGDGKKRPGC